jgi:hypothetical protein
MSKINFTMVEPKEASVVIQPGVYSFTISSCKREVSDGRATKGSEMLEMKLDIFTMDRQERLTTCYDRLIFAPTTAWRVSTVLACIDYKVNGQAVKPGDDLELDEHSLVGYGGRCVIDIQSFTGSKGASAGQEKKKNFVETYMAGYPFCDHVSAPADNTDDY